MGTRKDLNYNERNKKMNKYIYGAGLFFLGLFIGWLNPIEGPLDWTYDEYASQPSIKTQRHSISAPKKIPDMPVIDLTDLTEEDLENPWQWFLKKEDEE